MTDTVQRYTVPTEIVELLQDVQQYLRTIPDGSARQLSIQVLELLSKRVYNAAIQQRQGACNA